MGAEANDGDLDEQPIPERGKLLVGKYRVEAVVGFGGMGVVLAARHEHLGERVALKLLFSKYARLEETRLRFQREAQAAFGLQSPHVCRVYDAGDLEDGTPFIAMEFLKGDDLQVRLREKKSLPIAEAVDYVLQACDALAEAHMNGIVHRDLKPANLVLAKQKDGTTCLKVIDFGVSKMDSESSGDLTHTFGYVGSPTYSAPEQFESARSVGPASDIWSLGVILYQLVSGAHPFTLDSDSLAVVASIIKRDPPTPLRHRNPSIPAAFDAVVLRCLEKQPHDRWADVADLAEALAPFARDAAIARGVRERMDGPVPDSTTTAMTWDQLRARVKTPQTAPPPPPIVQQQKTDALPPHGHAPTIASGETPIMAPPKIIPFEVSRTALMPPRAPQVMPAAPPPPIATPPVTTKVSSTVYLLFAAFVFLVSTVAFFGARKLRNAEPVTPIATEPLTPVPVTATADPTPTASATVIAPPPPPSATATASATATTKKKHPPRPPQPADSGPHLLPSRNGD